MNVVAYLADVPAGESRLGRDVINQWLMVYNAPGESLLFEPLDV